MGLQPAAFWRLTPREFWAAVKGHELAEKRALKANVATAYFGAAFQRSKRLPDLNTTLRGFDAPASARERKPLTPEESSAIFSKLTRMYGGKDVRPGAAKE